MKHSEKLAKLRKMTVKNGCTEAEENNAASMIGKILMSHPEIVVVDKMIQPKDPPRPTWVDEMRKEYENTLRQSFRGAKFVWNDPLRYHKKP